MEGPFEMLGGLFVYHHAPDYTHNDRAGVIDGPLRTRLHWGMMSCNEGCLFSHSPPPRW